MRLLLAHRQQRVQGLAEELPQAFVAKPLQAEAINEPQVQLPVEADHQAGKRVVNAVSLVSAFMRGLHSSLFRRLLLAPRPAA